MAVTRSDVEGVLRRHNVSPSSAHLTQDQWGRATYARVLVNSNLVECRLDIVAHLSADDRLVQLDAAIATAKGAA